MNAVSDPPWDHPLARWWMRLRSADQARPQALDSLLALLVLGAGIGGLFRGAHRDPFGLQTVPTWVVPVTAAALALPLVWRRRAPQAVFWLVLAACTVQWSLGLALRSDISLMIALYGVARYASPRVLRAAAASVVPVCAVPAFRVEPLTRQPWTALFFLCCAATAAIALGLTGRIRSAQLTALAERAATLEVEREQREQLAAAAERARVSRELHDIVGHSLAVIVGLADGGAAQAELRPERGPEVLRLIAEAGRTSLAELRRTLGTLRAEAPDGTEADASGPELHPQRGTADIPALCERIRAAGPAVSYTASGDLSALGAGLQPAVYRIVQEALTNSLKHAGPTTEVRVDVRVDALAGEVRLRVDDTGPQPGPPPAAPRTAPRHQPPGQGLIGIRERAALAGGTTACGPRRGGGWSVQAVLPIDPRPADRPADRQARPAAEAGPVPQERP